MGHPGIAVDRVEFDKNLYGTIEAWRNRPTEGEHQDIWILHFRASSPLADGVMLDDISRMTELADKLRALELIGNGFRSRSSKPHVHELWR